MHRGRRRSLGGDAGQLATDAALAGLLIVALDPGDGTGAASVGNATGAGRRGRPAPLLGRVVVVVCDMAAKEVLAGKGLLADVASKAST